MSAKKIRSAVTDSGSDVRFDVEEKPGISNLLTIYSSLTGRSIVDLEEEYAGRGYGDLKKDLADVVVEFVTPFRDRTLELLDDQTQLDRGPRAGPPAGDRGGRGHPARRLAARRVRGAAHRLGSVGSRVPAIGVALSIPEPWATELQDYRTGIGPGGRAMPTHITLVPPTESTTTQLAKIEAHLDRSPRPTPAFDGAPARDRHLPPGLARSSS